MELGYRYSFLLPFAFSATALFAQFGPAQIIAPGSGSAKLQAVDLDRDGDMDLVGVFNGHHIKWLENTDGLGSFAPLAQITTFADDVTQLAIADVDDDGDLDLLVLNEWSTSVGLLRNLGNAGFGQVEQVAVMGSVPQAISTGDLNGDGYLDVVVTMGPMDNAGFAWIPGSATGFGSVVEELSLHMGPASSMLGIGDMDLIAGNDIILRGEYDELILVRNTNGNATAWSVVLLPIPAGQPSYPYRTPQLIDVDGDGDLDLAESRGSAVHWLRNDLEEGGTLTFEENLIEPWTTSGNGVFAPSPCGTGAAVVYAPGNPGLPVRWNSFVPLLEDFPFSNDLPALPRGTNFVLADLDGDGKNDLVMSVNNGISWYRNTIVEPTEELQMPFLDTLCMVGPPVQLPDAIPAGGEWYGTQVFGTELLRGNLFVPGLHPMIHAVYAEGGCPLAAASSIRLIQGPIILNTVPSVICSNAAPIQMSSTPVDVNWYGMNGSSILDPAVFSGGYVRCEYVDGTGTMCSDLEGPIQRWNALPAEIAPAGPFCDGDPLQTITASAVPPLNSEWVGNIVSSTNNTATFDPSIGPGEYQIILLAVPFGPNQCPNSDTLNITVNARPDITVTPIPAYCISSGPIELTGATPVGGVWSGTGVVDGILDPNVAGPGLHLLNYFVTSEEGCGRQAGVPVELANEATVTWTADDLVLCPLDEAITLNATPAGGVWNSPVGAEGLCDPAVIGTGSFPIGYTYVDPVGCELSNEEFILEVRDALVVSMDSVGELCANGGRPVLVHGSASGTWSGAVEGEGASIEIDPTVLGVGTWTVTLTAAIGDGCPGTVSQDIVIDVCTGVDELADQFVSIAPNPFTAYTRVALIGSGLANVDVLDASGRMISSTAVAVNGPSSFVLDLTDQSPGVYVVRTLLNGTTYFVRAIKAE